MSATEIPTECRYTEDHEWARADDDDPHIIWIGVTDYAQAQLGDVVMVDLPDVGDVVEDHDECGAVESPKSVSDIFSPMAGKILAVNDALVEAPELVNSSPYDDGWLYKIEVAEDDVLEALMDAAAYESFLAGLD